MKIFVGELENNIVGFCSLGKSRDSDANEFVGELYAIYIDSNCMNKGVGSALMQKGLEYLKNEGFKNATLWVLTSNKKQEIFMRTKGGRLTAKQKQTIDQTLIFMKPDTKLS